MNFHVIIALVLIVFNVLCFNKVGIAHEYTLKSLEISHPWAESTPIAAKTGAVFMVITNNGDSPDRLIKVSSEIAQRTGLHVTIIEDDIIMMRPIDFIEIPSQDMADLEPGSFHIMLNGLVRPLVEGEKFSLKLTFENSGVIEIFINVEKGSSMNHSNMDH